MSIDPVAFRENLGSFVTGVTVITAVDPKGEHVGITANSFSSLSLDPPMVLFSVDRKSLSLPVFEAAGCFSINVLSDAQKDLSNCFAKGGTDKWAGVPCSTGQTGCRLIDGALATFDCKTHAQYDGGDHVIFIGNVVAMNSGKEARPLVFYKGAYDSLSQGAQ